MPSENSYRGEALFVSSMWQSVSHKHPNILVIYRDLVFFFSYTQSGQLAAHRRRHEKKLLPKEELATMIE